MVNKGQSPRCNKSATCSNGIPLVTNVDVRNAVRKLQLPLPPPNGLTKYQNNPSFFITNSKKNKVK